MKFLASIAIRQYYEHDLQLRNIYIQYLSFQFYSSALESVMWLKI